MGGGVEAIVEIVAIVYYRQKGGFFRQKDKTIQVCSASSSSAPLQLQGCQQPHRGLCAVLQRHIRLKEDKSNLSIITLIAIIITAYSRTVQKFRIILSLTNE